MTHGKAFKNSFSQGVSRSIAPIKKSGRMMIFCPLFSFFSKFDPSLRNTMKWVLRGGLYLSINAKYFSFGGLRKKWSAKALRFCD